MWGRGVRGSCQVALKKKKRKKKSSLPRGQKVPVGCCLGSALARRVNSAVVSSPLVWRVVRALPPPLWLPRLKGTQWQAGSSRSLAASRKPASLPKVVVAAGSSLPRSRLKHVPDAAAAAAAAAVAAEPRKLHTSSEGGRSTGGRRKEGAVASRPAPESPASAPGATPSVHNPIKSPISQNLPLSLPGECSRCVLGGTCFPSLGLVNFLLALTNAECVCKSAGSVSENVSPSPPSQMMFPTSRSVSGSRISILVKAWSAVASGTPRAPREPRWCSEKP